MEKKITKKDRFTAMLSKYALDTEDRELILHEIELLERKASKDRKPTAKDLANNALMDEILEILDTEQGMTCTEIAKTLQPKYTETLTVNKISAMMTKLTASNKASKYTEKRKSYFVKC